MTCEGPLDVPLPERGADIGACPGPTPPPKSLPQEDLSVAALRTFAGITRPAAVSFDFMYSLAIVTFLFRMVLEHSNP
jgi:hypothetical protein